MLRRPPALLRTLACAAVVVAVLWGTAYLFVPQRLLPFPNWFWWTYPWWWPFHPQSFSWRWKPLLVACVAGGALVGVAAFPHRLRLRWTLALIVAASCTLQAAILTLPARGLATYARRTAGSGHAEFFVRAALRPDLLDSLVAYESHMRDGLPAIYSRAKGPANLGFHVILDRTAQLPPVRNVLQRSVADDHTLAPHVIAMIRGRFGMLPQFTFDFAGRLLPGLLLMPLASLAIASLLPLPAFLLGASVFGRRDAAVLGTVLAAAIPAVVVEKCQLDGSVFPLLFLTGLALFTSGWQRGELTPSALAGVISAIYLYFTVSAVVLVVLCLAVAAADLALPPRPRRRLAVGATYAVVLLLVVLLLHAFLSFRIVDRYADALGLQAVWRQTSEQDWGPENWRWLILNLLEFLLTLGPVLASLSILGVAVAIGALRRATDVAKFTLALAAVFASVAIFGRNSEVYRLWAFWGPAFTVPVVIAARALGGGYAGLAGAIVVAAHLLWLLPFATHFGWLP